MMQMLAARRIFIPILLALPFAILLLNRNWPFQSFGDYDAFFYFGHFLHFPHYQKLVATYAGERLPWILPGYAFLHIFGPATGELALHFTVWYVSVFSLYSITTRFTSPQTGFLTACALGIHPYFLAAAGMDYVTGACIAYALLSFALVVRPSAVSIALSGIAWAAAVYSYPLWLLLMPACILIYLAAHKPARILRDVILFTAGALALTGAFALLHHHIYGAGFNFLQVTLATARSFSTMQVSPWASKNFSVTYADWLVFPGIAAALAVWQLITARSRVRYLALSYLYSAAVMLILTLRPARTLEFDYFASFLIPGAFIVLGVAFFQLPDLWTTRAFWLTAVATCAISLAPLAHPGLYTKPPILGAVLPGLFLTAAAAIHLVRATPKAMLLAAPLLAASNFCLAPAVGGIAWRDPRDWMSATTRVAQAVKIIESRLPYDKYPAFAFQQSDPDALEYEAIMCAFLSHGISERNFPELDRKYPPGQILIILTSTTDGMPHMSVLWQLPAIAGGKPIWITAIEIPGRRD
jgi:hypothetical protein